MTKSSTPRDERSVAQDAADEVPRKPQPAKRRTSRSWRNAAQNEADESRLTKRGARRGERNAAQNTVRKAQPIMLPETKMQNKAGIIGTLAVKAINRNHMKQE